MCKAKVNRLVRMFIAAAMCLLSSAMTPAALARQVDWATGLDLALQPDFTRRDLAVIQKDLALDGSQTNILESLYLDYETAFRKGVDEIDDEIAQLRPTMVAADPEVDLQREQIRERAMALLEETRQAREEMLKEINEEGGGEQDEARLLALRMEFEKRAMKLREELQQMQEKPLTAENVQKVMEQSSARIDQWLKEKARLRNEFVAQLKAILTDHQVQELWPPLDQKLTREKTLGQGRLSGESIDLNHIIHDVHLDAASVNGAGWISFVQDYGTKLDQALQARNAFISSSQHDLIVAAQNQDASAAERLVERQIQLRVTVRNVNDECAAIAASMLPQDIGAVFTEMYRSRAYPRVYRTTFAQRLFNAAFEMDDLDEAKREAVSAAQQAYRQELAGMNDQTLRVVRIQEPVELKQQFMKAWQETGLEAQVQDMPVGPIHDEFANRDAINQRYARQLAAILTPEQFQRLPGAGALTEIPATDQ